VKVSRHPKPPGYAAGFFRFLCLETVSQLTEPVIPDELRFAERDPWFNRLTTLSEVEGESSESDALRHSLPLRTMTDGTIITQFSP
jgi:hypothetical protein